LRPIVRRMRCLRSKRAQAGPSLGAARAVLQVYGTHPAGKSTRHCTQIQDAAPPPRELPTA
jgi:hypothetical protein